MATSLVPSLPTSQNSNVEAIAEVLYLRSPPHKSESLYQTRLNSKEAADAWLDQYAPKPPPQGKLEEQASKVDSCFLSTLIWIGEMLWSLACLVWHALSSLLRGGAGSEKPKPPVWELVGEQLEKRPEIDELVLRICLSTSYRKSDEQSFFKGFNTSTESRVIKLN